MTARALILGLDGADRDLLARWADDGSLPILQALRRRGLTGRMRTPAGLGDDAFWASFYCGCGPGEHGRYYWKQPSADGLKLQLSRRQPPARPPFWQALSDAGQRVAVIDVPKSPAGGHTNGIQLTDWLVHGRDHAVPLSQPPELAAWVLQQFGPPPPSLCGQPLAHFDDAEVGEMRENLCRSATMKSDALRHFLVQEHWDLLLGVFKETHCATHRLWHLVDPLAHSYEAAADRRLGQPLRAVYQAVDQAIGEVLEQAGADCSVLVFTTLRMAPNHSGNQALHDLIERFNRAHAGLVDRARAAVSRPLHRHRAWRSEVCRLLPHNKMSAALRVNLAGRDPGGRVRPGAEYEALLQELSEELKDLEDGRGRRLVAEVLRPAQAYAGSEANRLPDLLAIWERSEPIERLHSRRYGEFEQSLSSARRSGNHLPGGSYLVAGPAAATWEGARELPVEDLAKQFLAAVARTHSPARAET